MSNLHDSYTKILSLLHDIEPNKYFLNQKRKPKLNDTELIALNLAAECLGIDSERNLFTLLPAPLKNKIDRTVYNRRRRKFHPHFPFWTNFERLSLLIPLERKARKRGMKAKKRGRSKEDWVPVLTVRDRGKHTYEAVISSVSTEQLNKELEGKIVKDSVLCSDGFKPYIKFAIKLTG